MIILTKTNPFQGIGILPLLSKRSLVLKRRFYHFLLFSVLVLFTYSVSATVYYVSTSGNDYNSGTSESLPWKTLTKVNSFTPKAGDQILFKRGEEWTGTVTVKASGISGNPIVYGAYGTGNKPKIYGSSVITGWALHSGNIYKATFNTSINQLFLNNSRMKVARYPNTGYALINTVNSTKSFTCDALNGAINYAGAKWIGRTVAFATVTLDVVSSSSKTLTLSEVPYANLNVNEGFILVNKLEFLDSAGEWYYNSATKTVYFWTPNGDSPANYTVSGSTVENGIVATGKDYISINDLEILNHKNKGITFSGNYVIVNNNTVSNPDARGIDVVNGTNCTVSNNTISGANHSGIFTYSTNCLIIDNKVNDTFLFNNIGISGSGSWYMGSGINIEGNDNLIKYNRVINSGYNGIQFSKRNIIEYNFINNALLTKDDGGGIYASAAGSYPNAPTAGSIIRNNIVDGVFGTLEGWGTWILRGGHGIFLDENGGGVTIENNTVANCTGTCIFLHKSFNETIRNNVLINARRGFAINQDLGGSQFKNNIVYVLKRDIDNKGIEWLVSKYKGNVAINNNIYINHYNSSGIFRLEETTNYDFAGWKAATGQDANSTIDVSPLGTGETEELFYNDTKLVKNINVGSSVYRDINGSQVTGTFALQPFTSKILIKTKSVINPDVTKPIIATFTIPATSTSLTVPVSSFTATDNIAVTGFKLTETSVAPLAASTGWGTGASTSYTFASEGTKTLYAWVKDAAGNVSASFSDQVVITLNPTSNILGNTAVYSTLSTSTNLRAMPVTFGAAATIASISIYHGGGTGNVLMGVYSDQLGKPTSRLGVTASTVISSTAGWQTVTLSSPVTVTAGQTVWLSWVFQNSIGVRFITGAPTRAVSTGTWAGGMPVTFGTATFGDYKYSIYCSSTPNAIPDVTKPIIATFTIPATSTSVTVPVSSFTATDNIAVTGFKLTETSVAPLAASTGWGTGASTSYTFASEGTKTLYAWVKDAVGNVSASLSDQVVITLNSTSNILGNMAVYSILSTSTNLRAMPVTFGAAATIASISIYHGGGTGNVLMGVYSDQLGKPTSRLGVTASTVINSTAGWQTVTLSSPVTVTAGQTVWLSWVFQNSIGVRFITGAPTRAVSTGTWAGGMPATFGTATFGDYKYSIYCTYKVNTTILKDAIIPEEVKVEPVQILTVEEDIIAINNLPVENSVISLEENDFKLYPNPAKSYVNVDYLYMPESGTTIEIIDGNGRTVFKKLAESTSNRIDTYQLMTGLYFIRSITNQKYNVKKLIIE